VAQQQQDAGHTALSKRSVFSTPSRALSEHVKAPHHSFDSSLVGNTTLSHL